MIRRLKPRHVILSKSPKAVILSKSPKATVSKDAPEARHVPAKASPSREGRREIGGMARSAGQSKIGKGGLGWGTDALDTSETL
jgi:hypothetical protein